MKRPYLGGLLTKPVEYWRRFRGKDQSDRDPSGDMALLHRHEREQRDRLRYALVYLLKEAKSLGYMTVAEHLHRAIKSLR